MVDCPAWFVFRIAYQVQSVYGTRLMTREQSRQVVFEYIENYYNCADSYEIGEVITFLLSDSSSYICGHDLVVDGALIGN